MTVTIINNNIAQATAEIKAAAYRAQQEQAQVTSDDIARNTARRTGATAAGWHVVDHQGESEILNDVADWAYLEWGTRFMAARPAVIPATMTAHQAWPERMSIALGPVCSRYSG